MTGSATARTRWQEGLQAKTTTVGVIIPDISSIFYSELARGIEDIATMYKYNIILSNSDQNLEKELHLLNTMLGKQVDGIVFMGGNITDEHVEEFKRSPVPIVLAASVEEQGETPSVAIDYEQAIYDAVKLLLIKGIAILHSSPDRCKSRSTVRKTARVQTGA